MADTTDREIAQMLLSAIDDEMEEGLVVASKIGEDALAISRSEHAYETQTGNLQSSCGFAISYDGRIVSKTPFTPAPGKNNPDGNTGSKEGKAYLEECMRERLEKGISLVMVAGMEYAGYVEDKGLDVLASAEAYVVQEFNKWARGTI